MQAMSHSMSAGVEAAHASLTAPVLGWAVLGWAVLIHTASMLTVAGILALAFFETYEKTGLQLLRHAWLNFDLLWAIALLVAGLAVLFL
jgi:hypothetical protein